MRLDGRRESSNVDDRRGSSGKKLAAGGGLTAVIIGIVFTLLTGGDITSALQNIDINDLAPQQETQGSTQFTAEQQELAKFSRQILAGTEDVWTDIFQQMGRRYEAPTMVLYTSSVKTACGNGQAAMGPFYCSGDQCLYIDLSFFQQMKRQLGADGDFAYAYVIAHEVGHHVEYLLGTLNDAHSKMSRMNEKDANRVSVRLELLADFYAGVWGHHDNKKFNSLEDGDLEEAIKCAEVIGDNYLQEKARGYSVPESFTHGTSAQRMKWLKLGLSTGDMSRGTTFQQSDNTL